MIDTLDTMHLHLCTCCRAASEHSSALVILPRPLDTLGQIIVWDMINVRVTRYLHWYGQWRPCLHCDRGDGCGSSHHKTPSLSMYLHTIYTLYSSLSTCPRCDWECLPRKVGDCGDWRAAGARIWRDDTPARGSNNSLCSPSLSPCLLLPVTIPAWIQ